MPELRAHQLSTAIGSVFIGLFVFAVARAFSWSSTDTLVSFIFMTAIPASTILYA
jgi:hypothetical protein